MITTLIGAAVAGVVTTDGSADLDVDAAATGAPTVLPSPINVPTRVSAVALANRLDARWAPFAN